jgi:hypothetical protein
MKLGLDLFRRRRGRPGGAAPIHAVFLGADPSDWLSLHTAYEACRADPAFRVTLVSVGWRGWLNLSTNCEALFAELGAPYVDGTAPGFSLAELRPDVIFTSTPYDQFQLAQFRSSDICQLAKVVYISYGVDFADKAESSFDQMIFGGPVHRGAWRIFTRSADNIARYSRYGVAASRVIAAGLPIIDRYYQDKDVSYAPAAFRKHNQGRFKILYCPHHSVGLWSTFDRNSEVVRDFVVHDESVCLVFRPHPGLPIKLEADGVIGQDDLRRRFTSDRMLYNGSIPYYGMFHWSDIMVTDASSFLIQFAPTKKPIVFLDNSRNGRGIDETIRPEIMKSYYVAQDVAELVETLSLLQSGADPKRPERLASQERMCYGVFSPGAGRRIADYVRDNFSAS